MRKESKITNFFIMLMVITAFLFTGFVLTGCPVDKDPVENIDPDDPDDPEMDELAGKILVFQAYGGNNANAVTHSFVELYNTTNASVSLNGYSLQYADGTGEWTVVPLTGSIPGEGSYLVLGQKVNSTGRIQIEDNCGDVNNDMLLNNRAFRVALVKGVDKLTVPNPFIANSEGKTVSGYVDMVGAKNSAGDDLDGFEGPADTEEFPRISAQEGIRRSSLIDTNVNADDFVSVRYSTFRTPAYPHGVDDNEISIYTPKNASYGKWDPFEEPEDPGEPDDPPTVAGAESPLAGKLLIFQAGASTDGAITRSYVELYNNSGSSVTLTGTYSLQYGTTGTEWIKIDLTGTIPAFGSFLVRGPEGTITTDSRLYINEADQTVDNFRLSNNGFKIALMANQKKLTVINPFAMEGGKAANYVDLLGAYNSSASSIDAAETASFSPISKQAAARRSSLTDSNNNNQDFERIDYRASGTTNDQLEQYKPRTSSVGKWEPFEEPGDPGDPQETTALMILQAGASTNGAITRSFVELYNNTGAAISLNNYSLQYGVTGAEWTVIELDGTIPSKGSYLVIGSLGDTHADNRLFFDTADKTVDDFRLSNNGFKVVLMSNKTALTVNNPFDIGGGEKATGYVDLIGATNGTNPDAYETALPSIISKQASARRKNLLDTDNNTVDFVRIDYRTSGTSNDEVAKFRPRTTTDGSYTPEF